MSKDAKGHGSNAKGIGAQGMRKVKAYTSGSGNYAASVYKNPEWGEHVVKFFEKGAYNSKADYHTDDSSDAHSTAQYQLRHYDDRDAQAALHSGTSKSNAAPTHDSMANVDVGPNHQLTGDRNHDAFGRVRSASSKAAYDDYNRDLSLRSRNGQVGSGMKFR